MSTVSWLFYFLYLDLCKVSVVMLAGLEYAMGALPVVDFPKLVLCCISNLTVSVSLKEVP
jgi:hypothetical protein